MGALDFLTAADLRALVTEADCVDLLATALASGAVDPELDDPRLFSPAPRGEFLLMPGSSVQYTGVNVITIAPENPARGKPKIQGVYVLFGSDDLAPLKFEANSFLIYKVSSDGKQAITQSCSRLDSTTCSPSDAGIAFDIAGKELTFTESSKAPIGTTGCSLEQTQTWTALDATRSITIDINNVLTLVELTHLLLPAASMVTSVRPETSRGVVVMVATDDNGTTSPPGARMVRRASDSASCRDVSGSRTTIPTRRNPSMSSAAVCDPMANSMASRTSATDKP